MQLGKFHVISFTIVCARKTRRVEILAFSSLRKKRKLALHGNIPNGVFHSRSVVTILVTECFDKLIYQFCSQTHHLHVHSH